ncbi:MAG TPA: glutaredoxin 3, partial [Methylovirgula sp.]|nr:glutaredoxin 3 [Methylovirgula sp.]
MSELPEITIYTTRTCPYCRRAKELLARRGLAFHEIPVDGDFEARALMTKRAHGRSTVPQIFFGDRHIGGCDDLYELHASGELDVLLSDRA